MRHSCLAAVVGGHSAPPSDALSRTRTLSSGNYLYRAGEKVEEYFYVRTGVIKTFVTGRRGDEDVTGFFYPGEWFGWGSLDAQRLESASSLGETNLCTVSVTYIGNSQNATGLLEVLEKNYTALTSQRLSLKPSRVDVRLARWIIEIEEKLRRIGLDTTRIPTPMKRSELANYLGMTSESLSRALLRLSKSLLIHTNRRNLEIVSLEAMRKYISEQEAD
ncbi:MAG: Crp/Fnr family transcriptional regulator [Pseudomonadota bacterium]|nr:Crp/Fnr family transcriptional regulator [Pseudomonadota bacterium]MEE3182296.1 Crp/Fnr family transcriptional regulator [Pseudomonadota bacterium]|tara:strand:- start:513 stop:1169 length:657 start_codon:yes stop_codon:yes gene_type:complete